MAMAQLWAVTAALLAAWLFRQHRRLKAIASQCERTLSKISDRFEPVSATPLTRLIAIETHLSTFADEQSHRLHKRHRATGLPTREPLFEAIESSLNACAEPMLMGLVELDDYHRLSGFDTALAASVLESVADRIGRMVGATRFVAHVDRAILAIWFGPDVSVAEAKAEFCAIAYALSDEIQVGDHSIIPEIFVSATAIEREGLAPRDLLARAVASLVPLGEFEQGTIASASANKRDSYSFAQDLRHAIARDELELVFQPFIDAESRRVCGAEALLRWRHRTQGLIGPAQFMPVVEASGLAEDFGLWTLNAACRAAARWVHLGLPSLQIAVNVSGHHLKRKDLPALVARTTARHALPPGTLEIELTETVAAEDHVATARLFQSLREQGVSISIDDFGTGYSSLSYLKRIGFDKLKIDREFVTFVDQRPDSQAICQSIVALARGLKIRLLAEGVERREEYEWLQRNGCTLFQGYYFAKPLCQDDFVKFVQNEDVLESLTATGARALQDAIIRRIGT